MSTFIQHPGMVLLSCFISLFMEALVKFKHIEKHLNNIKKAY